MLFENEQLNITRIHRVILYAPQERRHFSYPGKLPTHELMLYLEGDTHLTFHGKTFHMTPGSILYLPKGIENEQYEVKVNKPFQLYNIYFETDAALPQQAIYLNPKGDKMKSSFEKLYRIWLGKRSDYYCRSMQMAYGIFEDVRRAQLQYSPDTSLERLSAAEEYLAEHYCDTDFAYDKLVASTGLSYSYFKKLFLHRHGMPPVKYVTHLKIKHACELLETGQFSVSQVAALCGFENVYYFSNVFKKHQGVAPKFYAERR